MKVHSKRISCKLSTPELRERRETTIASLKKCVLQRVTLLNGYAYQFPSDDKVLDELISFIKSERLCCDFFSFQLTVEEATARLELTGPDGTREFIDAEIDL
jgi:hypothetical protein